MPLSPRDAEELAQRDMAEHARRLREFKAKTAHKVWHYFPADGLTLLIDHYDGTASEKPSDPFALRGVA